MTVDIKPRRSALYVPGNNERALGKAGTLAADVLILDLEDAVNAEAKVASRERVCAAVNSGAFRPREVVVRINGLNTEWHKSDVSAVANTDADGILVPKVESADEVRTLTAELEAAGASPSLKLWVMVETPVAFLRSAEIAAASDRLAVLVVGTNDLVNDLHAINRPGRAPVATALSLALLGARAAGKVILDGVFNDISDKAGFEAEAQQGRDMGYDGKTVVHPSQIQVSNDIYGPTAAEIEYAHVVVSSYEKALAAGESVIVVGGKMIESLHVRDSHRILSLDRAIQELNSANIPVLG
ncbi:HpcH/HpaI aldolase/citrate lyase family protein (plasmid) [Rhodococcus erythropolis]|uniref:HpcH/HpaI aldolase/citrate lyase family protein n=1 Tax=Rhodococcus erythropolis TaxID=1833 RepID=UPI00406BCF69